MRLLVDTHILLALLEDRVGTFDRPIQEVMRGQGASLHASVASLWEIAIKVRLRKLPMPGELPDLPRLSYAAGVNLVSIEPSHVLAEVSPLPPTRDPFDQLLLAQCLVENMRLVTLDRALVAHPLAWRPA